MLQGVKMAKAIRPLGAEESAQILSVLSDLGFHQSNTTKKQLEFSGSNLPTIYIQNKGTLETPVFGNTVCFPPNLDYQNNPIEGFLHRPSKFIFPVRYRLMT